MAEFKQIIDDALDILKFDGAVQDTLAELREKWGAQVPALLDERFDAVGVQYMKLWTMPPGTWNPFRKRACRWMRSMHTTTWQSICAGAWSMI